MRSLNWRLVALALSTALVGIACAGAPDAGARNGAALSPATPEDVGVSSARLARIGETVQAYVDSGRVAGVAVLIARRGRTVYDEAFGQRDVEAGATMTPDTIFRIASQTKAVTSVAAMILVEEGRLRLRDPVARHLPAFAEPMVAERAEDGSVRRVEADRPITVLDLLTHMSGLSYGTGAAQDEYLAAGVHMWYFADKDEPIRATIDRLAALPLDDHPRRTWIYGFSTDVLGAVVEAASGTDLDTFFRDRILAPLEMHDTHFYLPEEKRDRLAAVYMAADDGTIERAPDAGLVGQGAYVDGPRRSYSGGAGLLSTTRDYARFLQMLANDGELDGARILSPASVRMMTVNHVGDAFPLTDAGFGLGFQITLRTGARAQFGSAGTFEWSGAYHTAYWVDPAEELVVTFMTQLLPAGDLDLGSKFRAQVYAALVD